MWEIPRSIVNKLFSHAQRSLPNECVGILSGEGQRITDWHPLSNILENSQRFLADPKAQINLFKSLREKGLKPLVIYHSHPEGGAQPSATDIREAAYPDALHLIVAMGTAGCLDLGAWKIRDGEVTTETVTIVEA